MECKQLRTSETPEIKCTGNIYKMNNDTMVFQQNDLFPAAFPCMEDIRRQGKLCDVVLKVRCFRLCYYIFMYYVCY